MASCACRHYCANSAMKHTQTSPRTKGTGTCTHVWDAQAVLQRPTEGFMGWLFSFWVPSWGDFITLGGWRVLSVSSSFKHFQGILMLFDMTSYILSKFDSDSEGANYKVRLIGCWVMLSLKPDLSREWPSFHVVRSPLFSSYCDSVLDDYLTLLNLFTAEWACSLATCVQEMQSLNMVLLFALLCSYCLLEYRLSYILNLYFSGNSTGKIQLGQSVPLWFYIKEVISTYSSCALLEYSV